MPGGRQSGGRASTGAGSVIPKQQPPALTSEALKAPDCDAARGQMAVPALHVPSCVPMWPKGADNGGATYRGVTRDEVIVAIREVEANPAAQAALVAAGVNETPEDIRAVRDEFLALLQVHYETYGRKVKFVYFKASGADVQAQRADAVRVANEIKAFAVIDAAAPSAFVDELAARKVLVLTPGAQGTAPVSYYLDRAPYVWSDPMSTEQSFTHIAEFLGKRVYGRVAKWSGDAQMRGRKRTLGLVAQDDAEGTFQIAKTFMVKELARYGAKLDLSISYIPDIAGAQETSRTVIARLKDAGITTVVFAGDFLTPSFLTQEATRQLYFPEWFVTGMFLVDSNVFARTYDQQQWSRAFGLARLPVAAPIETKPCDVVYQWHYRQAYRTSTCNGIWGNVNTLMRGIHMAGPKLTPETYRDGMFAMKPTGGSYAGAVTLIQQSFGRQGFWPFDDYTASDDMSEVWWNPEELGRDELGNEGRGMYMYTQGGKRHLPGSWPATDPLAFVQQGAVASMTADEMPAADRVPHYEHKHYRGG